MHKLTLIAAIALAGCGDDTAPTPDLASGGDAGVADLAGSDLAASTDLAGAAQACMDYVTTLCQAVERCTPFYVSVNYGDTATCIQRLSLNCAKNLAVNGSNITAEFIEQCLPSYAAESCTDLLIGKVPPACKTPPGALAGGAACGEDSQCATTYCSKGLGAICGTCAAQPAAGADCSTMAGCGTGLICAANQKCVAIGGPNASCDPTHPCAANLSCVTPKNMAMGSCVAAAEMNQACDPMTQTGPGCDFPNGVYCNPASKTCKPIGLGMPGDACGIGVAGVTFCVAGGVCRPNDGGAVGTCIAPAADSGQCDPAPNQGPGCLVPAQCTNGLCTIPDPTAC